MDETARATRLHDYIVAHSASLLPAFDRAVSEPARRNRVRGLLELAALKDSTSYIADSLQLLYFSGNQRIADSLGLVSPLYNTVLDFTLNARSPWVSPPVPRPSAGETEWALLGKRIGFPIGVPASALTGSAEWVGLLANSGYNVITFKTVRSQERGAFPGPNWAFLPRVVSSLDESDLRSDDAMVADLTAWNALSSRKTSTANSFGVPSPDRKVWVSELQGAMERVREDQLLIVSVMGDHYGTKDRNAWIADFVTTARLAEEAGARNIELNVSCPNTLIEGEVQPPLCSDVPLTIEIAHAVRAALLPETKMVLKLAYMNLEAMRELVRGTAGAVDAYAGINTVQRHIVDDHGRPFFTGVDDNGEKKERMSAGVSGFAIRDLAVKFVRNLARLRLEENVNFDIIGMGGVSDPQSFAELYRAGATAVQSATGVFTNLLLAQECVESLGATMGTAPYPSDPALRKEIEGAVLKVISSEPRGLDQYGVAARLAVPFPQTYEALARLQRREMIKKVSPKRALTRFVAVN